MKKFETKIYVNVAKTNVLIIYKSVIRYRPIELALEIKYAKCLDQAEKEDK